MRRSYSVADFRGIVDKFRACFPKVTLETDIICGFPGEDAEAFGRTLRLIEELRPDVVNVSKFYSRPRTAAAMMSNAFVPGSEIKRRSSEAAFLAKRIVSDKNRQWVGWKGPVLVDEIGKVPGSWVGRNFSYRPVVMKSADLLLGKTVKVEITKSFPIFLGARIVE
jgi:threonylcarbamoyladenosine tRNA methylthiotransferase CDKAL1